MTPLKYFVHSGHVIYGGEIHGPYDTIDDAANSVARLVKSAFECDAVKVAIGDRSYTILLAETAEQAWAIVEESVR